MQNTYTKVLDSVLLVLRVDLQGRDVVHDFFFFFPQLVQDGLRVDVRGRVAIVQFCANRFGLVDQGDLQVLGVVNATLAAICLLAGRRCRSTHDL